EERLECGRRKLKTAYLIQKDVSRWLWLVAIFHQKRIAKEYACGGSILDHNTILTGLYTYQRYQISNTYQRYVKVQEENAYIQSQDVHEVQEGFIGKKGTIVGFGLTENDVVSDQLKQALVSVVDPLECIANYRKVSGPILLY
uniref:Peptidase S1 domain-containing protein n=1 Tax=Anopheles dirus TaxID=7168 RepID=A0A182MYG3_9DIPT